MHREAQLRGTEDRGGVVFVGKPSSAASAPVLVLAGLCSHYAPTKADYTNMHCTHRSPLNIGSVSLIIYKGFRRLCDVFGSAPPTEDMKLLGAVTAHPGFAMANRQAASDKKVSVLHPISRKLSAPQGEKKSPCSSGQSRGCGQGGLKPPGGRGVRRAGLCPSSASVPLPASPKARARQAWLKVYGQHNSTELITGKKKAGGDWFLHTTPLKT